MAGLPFRGATKAVTDAIRAAINLAFRERSTVATVAALRAVAAFGSDGSQAMTPGAIRFVSSAGCCYVWDADSTDADDGDAVIASTGAGTRAGRWRKATSPAVLLSTGGDAPALRLADGTAIHQVQSGYLRNVILYSGERTEEDFEKRIYGQRPCVVIDFLGRAKERQSLRAGQLAQATYRFQVDVISFCARPEEKGFAGSPLPEEAAKDPGAWAIAEDVEQLLDGALGEQLGLTAISHSRVTDMDIVERTLAGRRAVVSMDLEVFASIGRAVQTTPALSGLFAQPTLAIARPPGQAVDPDNVIVEGLGVSIGLGLIRAPANGSARIDGELVATTGASLHTFAASSDTYRDLSAAGAWTYTAVAIDAPAPAQDAGTLRIGRTRTSSGAVVEDLLLAPTLRALGDPIPVT